MLKEKVLKLIKQGESNSIEFKECRQEINRDVYYTVCAFLNRSGGEILLGVNDNGKITGIDKNFKDRIKEDFVTAVNNPQKINPSVYLSIEELEIEGKTVLYIYVPESSQVHRCGGRIYDRNEDSDLNITDNTNLVSELYIRKQTYFSENEVYPFLTFTELRKDLINRCRKTAELNRKNHPWNTMTDKEILKSMRLYQKDWKSGKEGYTLAAVLLFGNDDVILSVLPHHRTDAILRRADTERYDDRDFITTNLIESYDRLIDFTEKHLPDPFYQEGDLRISIRTNIFREVIVNSLIHREYLSHFPARFIIEKNRIIFENSNKPHGFGIINLKNFTPFPKNPVISSFFRQMNLAEELGSGFKKIARYSKRYFGSDPIISEKDIFRFQVNINNDSIFNIGLTTLELGEKLGEKLVEKLGENRKNIIKLMKENGNITIVEISKNLNMSTTAVEKNIKYLKDHKFIKRNGPAKGGSWSVIE